MMPPRDSEAVGTLSLLHVVPTYAPAWRYGGPIHAVHGLCKALVLKGHRVDVFTTNVDGPDDLDVPVGVPVERDGVMVRYFANPTLRRIYRSAALGAALDHHAREYDLIHLHSVFLWPTWRGARAARKAGRPWVVSPRGMLVPELIAARSATLKRCWIQLIERGNLRGAAAIHATSAIEADGIRRAGLDLAPLRIVENGVDIPAASERERNPHRIAFVGRVSWKKNLESLLDALATLRSGTLVVAGPDDEGLIPALRNRASVLGISDRVEFRGPIDSSARDELLASSACLVLPSINENFGNVVLEAMALGCPVVVTPGVGARDIVSAAGAGVVTSGSGPDAIAEGLRKILERPECARDMSQSGRAYVGANFAWPAMAERMVGVYREALEGHRRAA